MSIRPTPWSPAIVSSACDELDERHRDAVDRDRHARSNSISTYAGSPGSTRRAASSAKMSPAAPASGSSSTPHSIERPHRFASVLYGLSARRARRCRGRARTAISSRGHAPVARRREDLQRRIERAERQVEPHLVVALAVQPCATRRRPPSRRFPRASGRSAGVPAPARADSAPRRARRPAAPAGCSRARTRRARRARARAPRRRRARARAPASSSLPWPRSSVTATTSAPSFSASHGMATDVSSPPE